MKNFLERYLPLRAPDNGGSAGGGAPASTPAPSGAPASSSSASGASPSPTPAPSASPPAQAPAPGAGSPAPQPSPAPGSQSVPSSFDPMAFDDQEADDDFDMGVPSPSPVPAPAQAAPPQQLVQQPPQSPPQPAAPVQQQPPQPQQPAAEPAAAQQPQSPGSAPAQTPQASIPSPAEPGRIAQLMLQDSGAIIEHLAQERFQLSQEDIQALEADVTTAVPKLLARTFYQAQVSMFQQLERVVPAMMERYTTVSRANNQNEDKFYSRWPSIDRSQHSATVRRLAALYRQQNPGATLEQMIEDLGPAVMMSAKIPFQPGAPTNGGAPAQSPGVNTSRPPTPFRPAMPGAASPSTPQPENPWMGLAGPTEDDE